MTESDAKVIKLSRTRQTAKIRKSNQNLYSDGYTLITPFVNLITF